jgi:transposase
MPRAWYEGGYTAITDVLRDLGPARPPGFEVRFETPRATKRRSTSPNPAAVHGRAGDHAHRLAVLVRAMLGFSRLIWARFVPHRDMQTVLRCHMAAFDAIGGIPNEILYDRMKTAVIGEAGGSIVYNRALIDFARHYGFQPKACRAYRPKTKGKVERPFRYIREDFFLARSFRNLDDLNSQLRHWLDTIANPRVHATTQRKRQRGLRRGEAAPQIAAAGALPLAVEAGTAGLA